MVEPDYSLPPLTPPSKGGDYRQRLFILNFILNLSTGSYKTKEMGASARLPFQRLYSFFTVPDSYYFPTDDCHVEQGHHDKEQEAQKDGGQKT